jgi:hypothetical protein
VLIYFAVDMGRISENLQAIRSQLTQDVTLVAVSKTKPNESILEAYNAGHRCFGENRVHELVAKSEALPKDIEWHMIGHLQKNKVKYIAPFIDLIHSVDKVELLPIIEKEAKKNNRTIRVLLQFHIAQEETKYGLSLDEANSYLDSKAYSELENVEIVGVMGMATFTENESLIRNEFQSLRRIFEELKSNHFTDNSKFKEISMGMSGDFLTAMEEGSTMIRVGSSIFGSRG